MTRSACLHSRRTTVAASLLVTLCVTGCVDLVNPIDGLVTDQVTAVVVATGGYVEVGDTTLVTAIGNVDGLLGMFMYSPILDAKWTASDAAVARLERLPLPLADTTRAGVIVHGAAPGDVSVTATFQGVSGSATVHVIPPLGALELEATPDTIFVGDSLAPRIRVVDVDGNELANPPCTVEATGGIYAYFYGGRPHVTAAAPGPASFVVRFRRVEARRELVVVSRLP